MSGPRRTGAVLLVVEAIASVAPVLAVASYTIGGQMIGTALAHVRVSDVVAQGVVHALTPLLGLLLLLAAWGVAHHTRGIGALLLQPLVAAPLLIGFLRPMTPVSRLPAGMILLGLLVLVTTAVLVAVVVAGEGRSDRHRRWWWLAGYVAGIVVLAGIGSGSRSLPANPTTQLADPGAGEAPSNQHSAGSPVAQNPGLAANPFNSIHNDSWATDSYRIAAPAEPRTAAVDSLFTGGDCATITFDSRGRIVTLCSTLTAVLAYVIDPESLTVIDQQVVGTRTPNLTDFSGGGYFVLDADDRIVFPAADGTISVLRTAGGIAPDRSIPVADTLQPGERVTSVLPDWQGRYWYVGNRGTVGVVRAEGGPTRALRLDGDTIENSFAVTRDGVYVATGSALFRLVAAPDRAPQVRWRTTYDAGTRQKPGQTSRATGTTPTVFADGRYVAITDNHDPRMRVVVADTADGSVTCAQEVFTADRSATENSLIAVGDLLVVENNYGYAPPITATSAGNTSVGGLAAIDVDPRSGRCRVKWENDDIVIPSLVSKATTAGDLVLTYTKPSNPWGVDAWYFTAVQLDTGEIAWTRLAGTGTPFNNHYAAGYLSPSGDFLVGTVNGLVVLRDR